MEVRGSPHPSDDVDDRAARGADLAENLLEILPQHPRPLAARAPRNRFEEALVPYTRWVHPIPDDERWLPGDDSCAMAHREAGFARNDAAVATAEADLAAPRSSPIVAIGDGIVERVEKDRRERAGWYVSVAHDGGRVVSKYMHLDFIRDDLAEGMTVRAGEWLGSLGRTGVRSSDPHLHFEVNVRLSKKRERRVDPEPILRSAEVIGLLEMTVGSSRK